MESICSGGIGETGGHASALVGDYTPSENNPREDWADSIRAFIFPYRYGERRLGPIREAYIEAIIGRNPQTPQ